MASNLSKTEQRVLAGMRLAQRAHDADLAENGQPFEDVKVTRRLVQDISGITRDAGICTVSGRKPTGLQVYNALQSLILRGLVERMDVTGMGGGLRLYALTDFEPVQL